MRLVLAAALAILIVACEDIDHVARCTFRSTKIHWYADPEFTEEERTAIQQGADLWNQFPEISLTVEYEALGSAPRIHRASNDDPVIQRNTQPGAQVYGVHTPDGDLYLVPPFFVSNTAAHEMGHALGLKHTSDIYGIMCGYLESNHTCISPTAASLQDTDTDQLCDK